MEEMAELEEAAREKARGISLLLARDNEIKGIRDGTITSSKVWKEYSVCLHMSTILYTDCMHTSTGTVHYVAGFNSLEGMPVYSYRDVGL